MIKRVVKSVRYVLALPLLLMQAMTSLVGLMGMMWLARLFETAARQSMRAYYPIVVARRAVVGEDRWKPIDIMLGVQPPNAEAEALLKDDPRFVRVPVLDLGGEAVEKWQWVYLGENPVVPGTEECGIEIPPLVETPKEPTS